MDIRAVDQRDQTWEFPQPKYRVYFHDEAGAADEREVEGADVAEVMAWAEHSETVGPSRTASPRHQTLRAVVDWSYDLLEPPARRLFDRLGVFVGGFTLEAAEAVCAGEGEPPVAQSLAALVDKSLVTVDSSGPVPRYRLLGALRAYALARQAETGPAARCATATRRTPSLSSRERAESCAGRGSRCGCAAWRSNTATSAWRWSGRSIGATPSARLSYAAGDAAGVARALTTSGLAAFYAGDNPRAVRVLEEPVRQARAAGDRGQAGFALMYLSATALARTDWAEAVRRGGPARGDPRLPEPGPPVGPVNLPPAGRRPAAARTDHRRAVWLAAASEALRNSVAIALAELDHPPLPT